MSNRWKLEVEWECARDFLHKVFSELSKLSMLQMQSYINKCYMWVHMCNINFINNLGPWVISYCLWAGGKGKDCSIIHKGLMFKYQVNQEWLVIGNGHIKIKQKKRKAGHLGGSNLKNNSNINNKQRSSKPESLT